MENKKEVLSFFDYNVGDKVEYANETYVVTDVSIDKSDETGFKGYAGLSRLNSDGTYNSQAEFFIEAPTQALIIEESIDPNATVMDFDKIGTSINEWSSFTNSFSTSVPRAKENTGFQKLIAAGLESGFVASFDKNIENLVSALNQTSTTLNSSVDDMAQNDDFVKNDGESTLSGGRPRRNSDDYEKSSTKTVTSANLVNNAKEQLESYKSMSMNDLSTIANNLNKLGHEEGKTVDQLLVDKEYSEKIKNVMLSNQNISDELKSLIETGEIDITQQILLSIFNGTSQEITGLDNNTLITLKTHLNNIANANNIETSNLINNKNNSTILKESLKQFGNVSTYISSLNGNNVNENILNVYDGNANNIDSSSMGIIRNYVDQMAETKKTDAESMLTSGNSITEDIQKLGKASVFANSLSSYQDESIIAVLNNLFK